VKCALRVTDLTRMQGGRVCLAGYDDAGRCIRPDWPPVIETALNGPHGLFALPRAVVEVKLGLPEPQPPHTEDHRYEEGSFRFLRRLTIKEWRAVLEASRFASVEALFEQPVLRGPGFYVLKGQGTRSLGTIRPRAVVEAIYAAEATTNWDYRLAFYDASGKYYRLKITDLAWQRHCSEQRGPGREPRQIAAAMTQSLKDRTVYLRIGLARGWGEYPDRCYLQVTGVHTFPDYHDTAPA
jgi:hypothetical protein